MKDAEKRGQRIPDTNAVYKFLSEYAEGKGGCLGGHFSAWSPYRIADLHIKQLGFKEIPRPDVELTGISGSSKLYQFMGVEEEQQESRGVCVGVQTADGQVVANG
ncbi:unnamed protein product, partial [Pylaiella littoralis]